MTAITTTAAALQAHVTVATIRTWCRVGAVAAVKTAGRWVIDTASLAHRITIGQRKARMTKPTSIATALTTSYTATLPGVDGPTTITPAVKRRTARATGEHLISITGLAPLLADRIDAITDEGDRLHTLVSLSTARIVLSDRESDGWKYSNSGTRAAGRVRTTYTGTRDLPASVVLDLGEQLLAHFSH